MYKVNEIREGLSGLIGWRQNHNVNDFVIAEILTNSESGKYFQDEHPLLTLDNIKSIAPNFSDNTSFDVWLTEKTKSGIVKAIDTIYGRTIIKADITNSIIDKRAIFTDVISKQVAVDLLREFANNPNFRINRTSLNISINEIRYELDGDSTEVKKSGLAYRLDVAYQALRKECFPRKSSGISCRSMFGHE